MPYCAHSTKAPTVETVPCPRCVRGTWTGPNKRRFRCHFCDGTGRAHPEPTVRQIVGAPRAA